MKRAWLNLLVVVALVLISATPAYAQDPDAIPDALPDGNGGLPDGFVVDSTVFLPMTILDDAAVQIADVEEVDAAAVEAAASTRLASLQLPAAVDAPVASTGLSRDLRGLTGRTQVVVRLTQPAVAAVVGAAGEDAVVAAEVQDEVAAKALTQQEQVIRWVTQRDPSAKVLATLKVVLNAIIFDVDASVLPALALSPNVAAVSPVRNYEKDLSETVPAIGGTAAHNLGYTGTGVNVAVLDSGIDYTHIAFGGAGTEAAYDAAYANVASTDGLFPTAKVTKGYDFVGELWDGAAVTALTPDPDPIDTFDGHGTHVADIIAGQLGVAPGATLWSGKVCSAVSTACSGVAILQGLEWAVDPNGDGKIWDAADVINMSLGSSYGQIVSDDVLAVENATAAGVVVVISAGNSADRPYITGSPSIAPSAISVAQTTVPSDKVDRITAPSLTSPVIAIHQPWSDEAVGVIAAPLEYYSDAVGKLGCVAYPAGAFTGKIAIIDRGTCSVSLKTDFASAAGAIAVVIANNVAQSATDLPPSFSYGGGTNLKPTFTVTLADGTRLKAAEALGQTGTIDPANAINIAKTMVSTSSRGPSYSLQTIKPDIGAPGASVSAVGATGTGTEAFGGTSGAAPMVSGSAALVLQAAPNLKPFEVRALLMNNTDTQIFMNPATQPGYLAPITRIGAGEVRVDQAIAATAIAYEKSSKQGSLSFGYQPLIFDALFRKTVEVRNYTNQAQTYLIARSTRYPEDAWGTSWGVNVYAPKEVRVPARGKAQFDVSLYVYANGLNSWPWTIPGAGGPAGGDGSLLQTAEYDGYITLQQKNGPEKLTVPWHILPRKASYVTALTDDYRLSSKKNVNLFNFGVDEGWVDSFALIGTSPRIPKKFLPGIGDNYAIGDLRAVGARALGGGAVLQVGISTFGMRSHPSYPIEYDVWIDTDNDGDDEFLIWTQENGTFASSGQTLVYVGNLATGTAAAYYYADVDLDSGNMILTIPYAVLGVTQGAKINLDVETFDNYFQGVVTDAIYDMVVTPGLPKYGPIFADQNVGRWDSWSFKPVSYTGGAAASPSQTGLLLLYRNQKADYEADIIKIK